MSENVYESLSLQSYIFKATISINTVETVNECWTVLEDLHRQIPARLSYESQEQTTKKIPWQYTFFLMKKRETTTLTVDLINTDVLKGKF